MEPQICWVWLSLLNLSPKAVTAALELCGDAPSVYQAEQKAFYGVQGISPREAELLEDRSLRAAEHALKRCREQKLKILTVADPQYPERLRRIWTPPAVLYVQGELPEPDEAPVIAVIGTRSPSAYGIRMSREIAFQIASGGGTVLSLLTPGADEAAAEGALLSGKPVLAVLGTPHEACRWSAARRVAQQGAVISEYPPGKEQFRHYFRERNRVAAGLSDGVVVVEAPEKSGTRLFAIEAVEQGKDVFAVPGNADAENAVGTLQLLKEGAKLVTCGGDVLEEYLYRFPNLRVLEEENEAEDTAAETEVADASAGEIESGHITVSAPADQAEETALSGPADESGPADASDGAYTAGMEAAIAASPTDPGKRNASKAASIPENLSPDQKTLLRVLSDVPVYVDEIVEATGLPVSRVLAQLTLLEIKGFVRRDPGRYFALNSTR